MGTYVLGLPDEVWMCEKVSLQLLDLMHVVIKLGQ